MKLPIFYTDKLPDGVGGRAYGPIIVIKNKHRNDVGLHMHEKLHAMQWLVCTLIGVAIALIMYLLGSPYWDIMLVFSIAIHGLLYFFFPQYKLWSEVQCYRKQAKFYNDDKRQLFAWYISTHYDLDISTEEAYELLK